MADSERDVLRDVLDAIDDGQFMDHETWAEAIAARLAARGWRLVQAATPTPAPGLDVRAVAKAVENVAKRHGLVKDPPVPLAVMRIWGYSTAPLEMDAEIAAEYAALTPDRPTPGAGEPG